MVWNRISVNTKKWFVALRDPKDILPMDLDNQGRWKTMIKD